MDDYWVTVRDGVMRHCPGCGMPKQVYIQVTDTELIMACCSCSRVVKQVDIEVNPRVSKR